MAESILRFFFSLNEVYGIFNIRRFFLCQKKFAVINMSGKFDICQENIIEMSVNFDFQ